MVRKFQLSSAAVVYNVRFPCSGSPLIRLLTNCFDASYSLKFKSIIGTVPLSLKGALLIFWSFSLPFMPFISSPFRSSFSSHFTFLHFSYLKHYYCKKCKGAQASQPRCSAGPVMYTACPILLATYFCLALAVEWKYIPAIFCIILKPMDLTLFVVGLNNV